MLIVAVIATGESLTTQQIEHVHAAHVAGLCKSVAVSDAYKVAPWADCLVSNDSAWWRVHTEAMKFAGPKFCGGHHPGTRRLETVGKYGTGLNSGFQGMRVAYEFLKATKILLLGFDMHGGHFFGPHPEPLRNTTPVRFQQHIKQFERWRGCPVVNCTPGSALTRFPMSTIEEELSRDAREAVA